MKKWDDSRLVASYIEGNEESLAVLIDRHKDRVYGFVFSKVYNHNVAEDIFQETFIKVITKLKQGKYSEKGKFIAWVMRIAHNQTIDYFRGEKKMNTISENCTGDDFSLFDIIHYTEADTESDIIQQQIYKDVSKLVDMLPEEQREVLKLRLYKDLSFKEIAEETEVSINTALGRMRYALMNLRKLIEENKVILTV